MEIFIASEHNGDVSPEANTESAINTTNADFSTLELKKVSTIRGET